MKLLEYQGKQLLAQKGLAIPQAVLASDANAAKSFLADNKKVVVKAQTLFGKRQQAGLVAQCQSAEDALRTAAEFSATAGVHDVLLEEHLSALAEYFVSVTYDTATRKPVILFSSHGGTAIEQHTKDIVTFNPAAVAQLTTAEVISATGVDEALARFIVNVYQCFFDFDCLVCEVNPVMKTESGLLVAADAKITLDDSALARHSELADMVATSSRVEFSQRELAARAIDQHDHRGVAGKTFIELPGNIAVLASGGGASLTAMDALIEAGGQPANYTEYSGNPSAEKVRRLTALTLERPGLAGCLVVGGTANFTDIFETLSGVVQGLGDLTELPRYPIVIRRAGPRAAEAFNMVQKFAKDNGLDVTLYGEETPMSYAAKVMAEKTAAYLKTV